jgi:L-serine dehydratase
VHRTQCNGRGESHPRGLALQGRSAHKVSLEKVIVTMRQTAADMKTQYKEMPRGGLAVNIIEC